MPWDERLARIALTRVADPGDEVMGRAVRDGGPHAALRAARAGRTLPGAGQRRTDSYRLRGARADPVADLAAAHRSGGRFLCPGDGDWPGQLDDLGAQRPYGLWVRGRPSLRLWALRSVAVVGARACTDYGAHMAALLGAGLADAGWVVVSGAAYGVDGVVHDAVLRAGGATVGVVASGVDMPYPRGNAALIGRIAEHGLLIGELPPGEHPTRSRFVLRNRVIAALTRGTVVIEARYRSGSLITARRAARARPGHHGRTRALHQRAVGGRARTAARPAPPWSPTPPKSSNWSARSAPTSPRSGTARCCPATGCAPPPPGSWRRFPARARPPRRTSRDAAGAAVADTLGRLHELQALGFVARECGRWTLVRTARGSPRS